MKSDIVVKGPVNSNCLCALAGLECGDAFIHPLNERLYLVVNRVLLGGIVTCLSLTPPIGLAKLVGDLRVFPVNLDIKWRYQ